MRWDEFQMKKENEMKKMQEEKEAAVPERRLQDESRRITSKSAIKMCIKMSKNIYLHKVGHERMRQQLTEKEREGAKGRPKGQSAKLYNTIPYIHIYVYIESCTASGEQKLFGVAKVLAAYTFSPTRALSRMHSSHA